MELQLDPYNFTVSVQVRSVSNGKSRLGGNKNTATSAIICWSAFTYDGHVEGSWKNF